MAGNIEQAKADWSDLLQAIEFASQQFNVWSARGMVSSSSLAIIVDQYAAWQTRALEARSHGSPFHGHSALRPLGSETGPARELALWLFVEHEVKRLGNQGVLNLAQMHGLLASVSGRIAALKRQITPQKRSEILDAELVAAASSTSGDPPAGAAEEHQAGTPGGFAQAASAPGPQGRGPATTSAGEAWGGAWEHTPGVLSGGQAPPRPPRPKKPRRSVMQILLDPHSIQVLLALGGALMVTGLVILLWINEFFTPPVVAVGLGVLNATALGTGWWFLLRTRYRLAGRALTLMACLVMPLNLWYYHANSLITLEGHLWVAAVVVSALYAASALALREELFVYVFVGGVTLTAMLFLAGPAGRFWEIAAPATTLVVLGLLAIHTERAFPEGEGPFSRRRFGLAFFWSGHALLGAGLLLVLGAQIAGNWLYEPVFKEWYQQWGARPSPIVDELRWLALALVAAGTYAYIYSDLVVRRVGVYLHVAPLTLVWLLVLGLEMLNIRALDALIAVLAVSSLLVNMLSSRLQGKQAVSRAIPLFGALLPLTATALGLVVYLRAVSLDLKSVWAQSPPGWTYVGAMVLAAAACRVGAYVHRKERAGVVTIYFFGSAAALMVAATAVLVVLGLESWSEHAPWLMLVPIAYLVAARAYPEGQESRSLELVAHAATAVMLVSSLASAFEGFVQERAKTLNLILALFFAEAAIFYLLASLWQKRVWTVEACALAACGAAWQALNWWRVDTEYYTLAFALAGLGLMVVYRLALLEKYQAVRTAEAAFRSANALVSLAQVGAVFLGTSLLVTSRLKEWYQVGLFAAMGLIALGAVWLVRHPAWRRWYVVTSVAQGALVFFGITAVSTLTPLQKLEIYSMLCGLFLLVAAHVGWMREREEESDMVSLGLLLGSILLGAPPAIAALVDRSRHEFLLLNELGFLATAVLLLAIGLLFQIRATTVTGATLVSLYFVTLLFYVPWDRLDAVATIIAVVGAILFGAGLLLSVFRDKLLALPQQVKDRKGVFRVLDWR